MSRPIERLLAMDEMIRTGEYPSIADFMRKFAIHERAAYGDIQYLKRRFHAPLQFSKRQGGYFYTLIGWNLAKADTFTDEDMNAAPTTWLWKEIARRFGKDAALDLHRAFQSHQDYEHKNQSHRKRCSKCGKILSGNHQCLADDSPKEIPICPDCGRKWRYNHRCPAKVRVETKDCLRCGRSFRRFRNRQYCAECSPIVAAEYQANYYQRHKHDSLTDSG